MNSAGFAGLTYSPIRRGDGVLSYELLIASVGYEARATHIASSKDFEFGAVWAIEYDANRALNYPANSRYFEERGQLLDDGTDELRLNLRTQVTRMLDRYAAAQNVLRESSSTFRVAVDISCMNRDRIALVAQALFESGEGAIDVDFWYSPASFKELVEGEEGGVVVNRPIIGLDGWTTDPNVPVTCIIGAGFESGLAMPAIETIEPASTVWLFPRGLDAQFDELVEKRNYNRSVSVLDHVSYYDVTSPYRLLSDLDMSTTRLLQDSRVVIVPLGPKIFALCAILIGFAHQVGVTVWRLSADTERHPEDRVAMGPVIGVRVHRSFAAHE